MPTFRYRAIGPTGDVQSGMMDAATEAEVIARLQRQGSIPMRAEPAERGSWLSGLLHVDFAAGPRPAAAGRRQTSCANWPPCWRRPGP